ncbi:hypothetical protein AVEN_160315-1 [Araneus ventricosus]|uniref:Uncharacterized protein n=1 Tax=Araneus ventricosus TaxID=182803 RepID=A0A4Y2FCR4_ARAVE|nr:hypothetical protein AVEN_160315-1 [Araneus ventricosus]
MCRKVQTLFRQDVYHHLYYHRGSYITDVGWLMLLALSLSLGLSLGLVGNGKGNPIYTWMNSARAELHLLSILHGRIKFHLPPHGKARDENAKVREAATSQSPLYLKLYIHKARKSF